MCYSETSIEYMDRNCGYPAECALVDLQNTGEPLNADLPEYPDGFAVISEQPNGMVSIALVLNGGIPVGGNGYPTPKRAMECERF